MGSPLYPRDIMLNQIESRLLSRCELAGELRPGPLSCDVTVWSHAVSTWQRTGAQEQLMSLSTDGA